MFLSEGKLSDGTTDDPSKSHNNEDHVKEGSITPVGIIRALSRNDVFTKVIEETVNNTLKDNMDKKSATILKGWWVILDQRNYW